jgi:hypothetical protein
MLYFHAHDLSERKRKGRLSLPLVEVLLQKSTVLCVRTAGDYFWAGAGGTTGGAAGAGICCWTGSGFTLSMRELFLTDVIARKKDVIMKIMAAVVVSFARKLWAPLGPNTVFDAPPKAAPMSAPLPFCSSTIPIRMAETMT